MYVFVFIGHHRGGARFGAVCMWEPAPALVAFWGHDATSDSRVRELVCGCVAVADLFLRVSKWPGAHTVHALCQTQDRLSF